MDNRKKFIKIKNPDNLTDVAKLIYLERKSQVITIDELSKKSGVSADTISCLELGKRRTNISTIILIAEALGKKLVVTYYDNDKIFIQKIFEDPYEDSKEFFVSTREQLGLSQGKFAKKIGRKQGSISEIESGTRLVSIERIKKIGEALGYRVEFEFL